MVTLVLAIFFAYSFFVNLVEPGHRAIIFDRFKGILPDVKPEGTHFRLPIIQDPIMLDVRTQAKVISTVTGTKDLQTINLTLRVLCRPKISELPSLFKQVGLDWSERVLPGICNEVLKAVVAQHDAAELLTLRDQVSMQIRDGLTARAKDFNIELDDVSLTHLNFSKEFSKAIEDKQVAEQQAERAKFIVAKAEQEKEAAIIRAEGDSEAARLLSDAMLKSGKGLIDLRRIDTSLHVAHSLVENPNVTFMPQGANMLLTSSQPPVRMTEPKQDK